MRKEMNNEFIVEENKRVIFKRKAKIVGAIVIGAAVKQLTDPSTYACAGGIGLAQGLKYKGDFKLGVKSGLVTVGVLVGVNIIGNIASNIDKIKDA